MKKVISLLVLIVIFTTKISAQNHIELVDTTKYYAFSLNYWFNMHHMLWMEVLMNAKADSSIVQTQLPGLKKSKIECRCEILQRKIGITAEILAR